MWTLREEEHPALVDSSDEEEEEYVVVKKKNKKTKPTTKKTTAKPTNRYSELALLRDEEEEGMMMAMNSTTEKKEEYEGFVKVTATVDSGSAEHALPSDSFNKVPAVKGKKFGRKYLTANGERISNEGEKTLRMTTASGVTVNVRWQMTRVVEPLLSVRKLTEGGSSVVLDKHHPRIVDPRGQVTPLRMQGGVFVVDLWIRKELGQLNEAGFTRQ